MSRSPKSLSSRQDEPEVVQESLSFFPPEQPRQAEISATRTEGRTTSRAKKQVAYSAADIQVLEGLAAIRHRPGMYIGSTSTSGLVHLIREALDNAVDEAVAGFGKHIWVGIDKKGWGPFRDGGRGMPFDPMLNRGNFLPPAIFFLTFPHPGG